jgi:hypothetical protein
MAVVIKMGYQPVESGGFRGCVEWKVDDLPETVKVSDKVYSTEQEALAQAEYFGRLLTRIAEAAGYGDIHDVTTS